jgi:hypothetical protein
MVHSQQTVTPRGGCRTECLQLGVLETFGAKLTRNVSPLAVSFPQTRNYVSNLTRMDQDLPHP